MFRQLTTISLFLYTMIVVSQAQDFELLSDRVMDFGTVMQDSVLVGKIEFINSGSQPMVISRVHTSCGCTVAKLDKMEYQPGEKGEIQVSFNTKGFSGFSRKYVTITLSQGQPVSSRVVLQTKITTPVQIEPAFLDLQNITLEGEPNERYLEITNNTDQAITVEEIKTNIKNLDLSLDTIILQPGSTEKVKIIYSPSRIGRNDGFIDLKMNTPASTIKRIPVFINVRDTAVN
jgi:uncharacterized protein YcfL